MPASRAMHRLARSRVVRLFTDRRQWVRQVFVTSIAAALAWQVGDRAVTAGGLTAAIAAALTVQVSLHKSMREGFGQILGTTVGAGIATGCQALFGFGAITVAVTVGLSSVAARALRLGTGTSVNVAITALIVIGPGLAENTALHRLGSIIIGTLIGMVLSYFSHPKDPAGRTIDEIGRLAGATGDLLDVMSSGVADGFDRAQAGQWLARARVLTTKVPQVRAQALEARDYARWFPTAERAQADDLYTRAFALDHAVDEVATIARALFDAAVEGGLPPAINQRLADALASASVAMNAAVVDMQEEPTLPMDRTVADDVRHASAELAEQLLERSDSVEQEQIVRGMSIASGLDRIADSIDQSAAAIHEVPEPGPPTAELVLKLPGSRRRRRRR